MKTIPNSCRLGGILAGLLTCLADSRQIRAATTVFFDVTQTIDSTVSGTTSDTITTQGYRFTFTRDKLFTGGVGLTNPIGRTVRVPWPTGLEAQAVTTGPVTSKATFTLSREDSQPFAIESFAAKLLANTAGAGGAIEVVPLLNGEEPWQNPLECAASGFYGSLFNYTTPSLTGFDTYQFSLYVDFALMHLTLVDASLPPPVIDFVEPSPGIVRLSWPSDASGYSLVSSSILQATQWSPVTEIPVLEGGVYTVELSATGPARYFRLQK